MDIVVTVPNPKPRSKWAKAISLAEGAIDVYDNIAIGVLSGSQLDKETCLNYLRNLSVSQWQARRTTGNPANERRWEKIAVAIAKVTAN